jgi:hypothetical protein
MAYYGLRWTRRPCGNYGMQKTSQIFHHKYIDVNMTNPRQVFINAKDVPTAYVTLKNDCFFLWQQYCNMK